MKRQVIVVTGASAGVGRAVARRFARDGASIALLARGSAGLEGARHDVELLGGTALVVRCDVSVPGQVEAAAERVEQELGPIDVWVNAAAVTVVGELLDIDEDEFRRVNDVTYLGAVNGTRAALRTMLPRDRGTIVQVSSAAGRRGLPLQSATCAARHAVLGFTDSVRREVRLKGSRVWLTTVELPALNTPQFEWSRAKPSGRVRPEPPIFAPEVAAEAVLFASRSRRRTVSLGRARAILESGGAGGQRDNLFSPVDDRRDHGARGRFVFGSRTQSARLWASMHRTALAIAGGVALAGIVALRLR